MNELELKTLAEEWQGMIDRDERNRFYNETVFPAICQVVVPRESNRRQEHYSHLILPLGLSPEPLILTIKILRPERVYILYTRQSEEYLDKVVRESGLRPSQVDKDEVDETNVPDIYQKVKNIFIKWGEPAQLAADISGGKKSMIGAVALGGIMVGANLFYMDSTNFIQELRKPFPGSERLVVLENPYDVFGDLKLQRAQDLFAELDFNGAFLLLDELRNQTSTPDVYEARALLCRSYAFWDDWQIESACNTLDNTIKIIDRYSRLDPSTPLGIQRSRLQEQRQLLQRLTQALGLDLKLSDRQMELLTKPSFYQPMIATLRACALRQEHRGKFDVAVLLWYRLVEFLSQRRLSQYGLMTSRPDYSQLGVPSDVLLTRYQKALARNQSKKQRNKPEEELPSPIELLNGYALLFALEDPFLTNINLGKIQSQISVRNHGIFAHGFTPLKFEDYQSFKDLAIQLLDNFAQVEKDFLHDWETSLFIDRI